MVGNEYDGLRADIRSIVDKIDKLMSREEYERRHANIEERVSKIEADMRSMAQWSNAEHNTMRTDVATRFDKILEKFDDLKSEVLHSRSDNLKWALGIVLSFVLGGGLVGTLLALHIIK
jgi:hypothetical protein